MPIDPMSAITILNGAIESVKGFKSLIGEGKNKGEVSEIVLDLQGKLTEGLAAISTLIGENHQLKDEIRSLKKEIDELNEKFKFKGTLVFENNYYWINKGGEKDGPFCSGCWDKNSDPVRIVVNKDNDGVRKRCPVCGFIIFKRRDFKI